MLHPICTCGSTPTAHTSAKVKRSKAAGYFFLSDRPKLPIKPTDTPPKHNGAVLSICQIIDAVISSAQDTETGTCFINAKRAVPLRTTLDEMGHQQETTPIQVDNKTSEGIINEEFQQKHSKAMDMRFYWFLDRVKQKKFHVFWKPGPTNKADYVSKNHPTRHHINVRPTYVLNALKNFTYSTARVCWLPCE